jgi:hypothetical protein
VRCVSVDNEICARFLEVGIFGFLRDAGGPAFHGRLKAGGNDDFVVQVSLQV